MSFEPDSPVGENPIASVDQPKSKKKFWLFGGCGCLLLITVICVGGGAIIWFQFGERIVEMQNMLREAREGAAVSPAVANAVGEPVTIAEAQSPIMPTTFQKDGITYQEYRYAVTGSKANAQLIVTISQKGSLEFDRESVALELEDGTKIDLNLDEELSLDIDMGE